MTPQELYDLAVENGAEDYDLMLYHDELRVWGVVTCANVSVDELAQTVDLKLNRWNVN